MVGAICVFEKKYLKSCICTCPFNNIIIRFYFAANDENTSQYGYLGIVQEQSSVVPYHSLDGANSISLVMKIKCYTP